MATEVTFKLNLKVDGKDVVKNITMDVEELQRVIGDARSASEKFTASLIKWNQLSETIGNFSSNMSQLSNILNNVTAESRSFGAAMASANTMAGKSGEDFAALKDQVAELSKTIPIARDELANGLYQVISNGVPEDNWIEYLEKSAKASVGGIADLGETVKVTSTVIKNYGLSWSSAGEIQDKIQLTAKNGVTSFEQMAQALPRVTANAATLGVSIDELMATFATLTGVSGNTAEVSTQLAAIFTALIKPSSEAAQMAQQMGIQFDAAAIKAAGGMEQFLQQLDQSVKQYSKSSGILEQEVYGKLFGSAESLRAITPLVGNLSEKFSENVEAMKGSAGTIENAFDVMASTGAAKLQVLNNKLGEVTDTLQSLVGNALPYLNFASQTAVTLASVAQLSTAVKAMAGTFSLASIAGNLWNATTVRMSALTTVCSASMRGAAVSATTLKLAIQGLMIATGVGIAVVALTTAIGYFTSSSDDAAESADQLTEAEQRLKQAHEQQAQQIASVTSEMTLNIAKLKDFKGSKEEEKTLVQQMNAKYGDALGYYSTVSQWYTALVTNSKAYCNQMINEIRLRDLANKAAKLQQQQRDIRYNEDGTLKKYSATNKKEPRAVGQVDTGDGIILPIKQEVEIKGTSELDEANRQLTTLYRQEQNVRKEMEKIISENNKITFKKTDGYSATNNTPAITPPKTTTPKTTTPKSTTSSSSDPVEGSIAWYEQAIDKKKQELNNTADEATAKILNTQIGGLEQRLNMLKIRLGVESVPPVEVDKEAENVIDRINAKIEGLKVNPIKIDVKGAKELENLERLKDIQNVDLSSFEQVQRSLVSIKSVTDPTTQGLAAAGASCQALGQSMQQLGADSAAAKVGLIMAALGQIALSFAQALNSASSNWITWLAFGIAGTAQMISMVSTISQFATGGIVGGNETSGDKVLVRVNSGEMILNAAQQARLFAIADGTAGVRANTATLTGMNLSDAQGGTRLVGKVRGRDIVLAAANETRSRSRRSNIRI